jgi:hypothetical protein
VTAIGLPRSVRRGGGDIGGTVEVRRPAIDELIAAWRSKAVADADLPGEVAAKALGDTGLGEALAVAGACKRLEFRRKARREEKAGEDGYAHG